MRSLILLSLLSIAPAFGAEIPLPVNSESLTYWSITGAERREVTGDPLDLPPATELGRRFLADTLKVEVDSRPIFSAEPESWALLELGSVALVFARDGDTGLLVLVADDENGAVLHPVAIPLGADGRSREPVQVILRRVGGIVSLEVQEQEVVLAAPAATAHAVVVSTGADAPWTIDGLIVTLTIPDEDISPELRRALDSGDSEGVIERLLSAGRGRRSNLDSSSDSVVESRLRKQTKAIPADYRPLEIYTPPAVRSNRAEQVRAAVNALRLK